MTLSFEVSDQRPKKLHTLRRVGLGSGGQSGGAPCWPPWVIAPKGVSAKASALLCILKQCSLRQHSSAYETREKAECSGRLPEKGSLTGRGLAGAASCRVSPGVLLLNRAPRPHLSNLGCVSSSANSSLECDWSPVSFLPVHHHGSKMLRSESNSSITTTQPTIGWRPLSLPLPLTSPLSSFDILAFVVCFQMTRFIHQ